MQIRGIRSAGPSDDQARFLADLRALRDSAAIGHDELAARAHYPSDILQEAENGPRLPGLPILTAYVRACEGDVLDWEERWRQLNAEVPEDPSLPVRPPGASPAAAAGARAGVSVAPPDVYDPDRIRAALRGGHNPPQRAGRQAGDLASLTPAANGNHSTGSDGSGPFDTAYAEAPDSQASMPDPAASIAPAQDDNSVWLPENAPVTGGSDGGPAPGDSNFDWLKPYGAGDEARPGESNVMWSEAEAQAAPAPAEPAAAEPAAGESRPWQQDSIMKPPQREDFWTTPGPGPSDLQPPAVTQTSWASPAEAAPAPPEASAVPPPPAVPEPAAAQPQARPEDQAQGSAHGPAHAQPQAAVPQPRRPDRLFSVKLIVVIIIAALIGSALVLLLK